MSYSPPLIATVNSASSVAASITSVQLLAASNLRKQFVLNNESTSICYVQLGATASATAYTIIMPANSASVSSISWLGTVNAIWVTATGFMRISDLS